MLTVRRTISLAIAVWCFTGIIQAQSLCPGFNPANNTNLACAIATATLSGQDSNQLLGSLSPTLAGQLTQLPVATAVSGSGLTFSKDLGIFTATSDSLGTTLTQRGETLGRHRLYVSFTYQRFGFGSLDGISLKDFPTVNRAPITGATVFTEMTSRINLRIDQFAALAAFGLTNRVDVAVVVPFSKVTLGTGPASSGSAGIRTSIVDSSSAVLSDFPSAQASFPGSANGIGDVLLNVKANIVKGERTNVALGGEVRLPSGDQNNYLGSGAYGVKPYFVISRSGRITPNLNLGFQWNGKTPLYVTTSGAERRLPSTFNYSGGVDFRVTKRFTVSGEFIGQWVAESSRLRITNITIGARSARTVSAFESSYAMNNIGAGFKLNPFKGLLISANALFKLDDGGLRSKVVPLVGISYRF